MMPCKIKYHRNAERALPSTGINKQTLRSVQEVLEENISSRTESCAGTLCQRLAREAVFGEDVISVVPHMEHENTLGYCVLSCMN